MVFKSIIGATCACLAVVSFNANAIPIERDYKITGDGLITYDANTGLEWLDLTVTTSRTYLDISTKLGAGQEFDGWAYASRTQVSTLWDSFGGSGIYTGASIENNGLFDIIAPLMGDAYCAAVGCVAGQGLTKGLTADEFDNDSSTHYIGFLSDDVNASFSATEDVMSLTLGSWVKGRSQLLGSFLIRTANVSVPEPSIAILMFSGLIAFGAVRKLKGTD